MSIGHLWFKSSPVLIVGGTRQACSALLRIRCRKETARPLTIGRKLTFGGCSWCQRLLRLDNTPLRQICSSNRSVQGGRCGLRGSVSQKDRTWSGRQNYVETWGLAGRRVSPAPEGHRGRSWEQKGPPGPRTLWEARGKAGEAAELPPDPPPQAGAGRALCSIPSAVGSRQEALSRALKRSVTLANC